MDAGRRVLVTGRAVAEAVPAEALADDTRLAAAPAAGDLFVCHPAVESRVRALLAEAGA